MRYDTQESLPSTNKFYPWHAPYKYGVREDVIPRVKEFPDSARITIKLPTFPGSIGLID